MGLKSKVLPPSYYRHDDVVYLARDLLGKTLHTHIDGRLCSARITETEAYCGRSDKACHAYGRQTPRTAIMYGEGGRAYVYLCYGIHHLFNIVTNQEGLADAVLIRAVEPLEGIEHMLQRRNLNALHKKLTAGPGSLSKAMGITTQYNGSLLWGEHIWLEEGLKSKASDIVSSTRIGVDYAGKDALLPWRFYLQNSAFVSKR